MFTKKVIFQETHRYFLASLVDAGYSPFWLSTSPERPRAVVGPLYKVLKNCLLKSCDVFDVKMIQIWTFPAALSTERVPSLAKRVAYLTSDYLTGEYQHYLVPTCPSCPQGA